MRNRLKANEIVKSKKASRSPYSWPTTAPISWIATRLKTNFAIIHELYQANGHLTTHRLQQLFQLGTDIPSKASQNSLTKKSRQNKISRDSKVKQANKEAELWTLAHGYHLSSMALVWEAFASSWSMSIYTFFSFYNVYLSIDYFISSFYCSVLNFLNGLGLIPSVSFTLS